MLGRNNQKVAKLAYSDNEDDVDKYSLIWSAHNSRQARQWPATLPLGMSSTCIVHWINFSTVDLRSWQSQNQSQRFWDPRKKRSLRTSQNQGTFCSVEPLFLSHAPDLWVSQKTITSWSGGKGQKDPMSIHSHTAYEKEEKVVGQKTEVKVTSVRDQLGPPPSLSDLP